MGFLMLHLRPGLRANYDVSPVNILHTTTDGICGGFVVSILIIDDDQDIQKLVKATLESEGMEVLCASNSLEGKSIIAKQRITLAIVDVNMPDQNGFDLAADLRRLMKNLFVPVLFLTARSDKADIETAKKLNIEGYMIKPIDPKAFAQKVNAIVQKYSKNRKAS